jgi:hypothetical protein
MFFSENELQYEWTIHNKSLHIIIRCEKCIIIKVLIDNDFALNVLPWHILDKIPVDISHMRSSTMIVRAYDGLPTQIIGNIEIKLVISP